MKLKFCEFSETTVLPFSYIPFEISVAKLEIFIRPVLLHVKEDITNEGFLFMSTNSNWFAGGPLRIVKFIAVIERFVSVGLKTPHGLLLSHEGGLKIKILKLSAAVELELTVVLNSMLLKEQK